ncbi:M23 family metallopeptidase [Limnohabitans sp. Jir72]|uniref:M23 family metallopeptidase n=1 Tax=Limnohabitans sp. Jir72 TaxID=1977909 RepID=UPI000D3CD673|nr:M23 family metallopeptidase [Limnohabitans sp. Jir72]PUE29795.1 hypothetical protein B9Z52_12950 [Limnohabitans sp. Jir72]
MIISLPFLADAPVDTDDDLVRYAFGGNYPISSHLEWHNGIHLIAPSDQSPVRAIADGKVIFVNAPDSAPSTEPLHPQNYGSANPQETLWTDKGMVIVEHTTEIGANGATPVELTYYSVYMHLKSVDKAVGKDKPVYRKDRLGEAGQIYGQRNHMHFEICMNEANLSKLLGHARDKHPEDGVTPSADGRVDAVFGSTCVFLPATTPVLDKEPGTHMNTISAGTLGAPMWLKIDYAGNATIGSYTINGEPIGAVVVEPDGEYQLYKDALKRHGLLTPEQQTQSSPSGWYELLRFGRNLGPDPLPSSVEHWRKVATPSGEKYVNLNVVGSFKFSEADFPVFLGWQCIADDDSVNDQRCDSPKLRTLLARSIADMGQREKALKKTGDGRQLLAKQTAQKNMAAKMRKLICKFPSEFEQGTFEERYGHIKEEDDFKSNDENWKKLKAHIQALTRTDLPQVYKDAQWHVHPVSFIEQMRKCGWLSKQELVQCIPSHALRTGAWKDAQGNKHTGVFWEEVASPEAGKKGTAGRAYDIIKNHYIPLNRMMRKYGISSKPLRMVSLLGNALQETGWLSGLQEAGGSGYWYTPWHGRGMLQLTHAENYFNYWRWRGRKTPAALEKALKDATQVEAKKSSSARSLTALADNNFIGWTSDIKDWREDVSAAIGTPRENTGDARQAPTDSAGYYALASKLVQYADEAHTIERVSVNTVNVSGVSTGAKVYYRSLSFWKVSASVNLPGVVSNTNYSGINGFDSRCSAYGVLLAMLTETYFSDAQGNRSLLFPEGYERRKQEVKS